ncbi:Zinc finger CCHC domain-containing protein 2 [Acipenser ruthenus]|uniref:Zinc finger CCHC domain-containing protein 2 n=1 Tax=Acipenser ruthenus TaxID=7906 RepID=A0A444TZG3_ACIRT|nr:Zinc finger CCHC domain-containing protein 2 [Acipenser ruthenus]
MVEKRCLVQREGVYRWFSELNSAQRVEFLCGLLDLCVPIELRFLGCSLEDLARKDYHSLRDAEVKANNAADLATLTNITDEVVRSKLLVALALLNSDNREAAGVLFTTLTHIDSIINNYGLQLNDGQTQLLKYVVWQIVLLWDFDIQKCSTVCSSALPLFCSHGRRTFLCRSSKLFRAVFMVPSKFKNLVVLNN